MTGRRWRTAAATLVGLLAAVTLPGAPGAVASDRGAAAPAGPAVAGSPAQAAPPDPGVVGPHPVEELEYDLGDEAFRPTAFPGPVELRAKVYAPQTGAGRAPIVVVMHGRHVTCANEDGAAGMAWPCPAGIPEVPSYRGYDELGRNLASHGTIVVSIGANGINAVDGYVLDAGMAARGQLVVEHLRRWQAWDAAPDTSPFGARFVGRVDLGNVGLVGHSRGGEGVVDAAQLNQRIGSPFGIRSVVALAPVDFGRRVLGGVPLGVVLPYCDGDVSDLQGAAYYDDSRHASPGDPAPKSTMLLYGANHNWFNTVWTTGPGSFDDAEYLPEGGDPSQSCANGNPGRLAAADQARAGAVLMAGFLRRHLLADASLQRFVTGTAPFPASTGPARWAIAHHEPDRLDVETWNDPLTTRRNRFGRAPVASGVTPALLCNPGERNLDPDRLPWEPGIVPCAGWPTSPNTTRVLDVGWLHQRGRVAHALGPAGVDVRAYDGLRFRVAVPDDVRNTRRATQALSVILSDTAGNRSVVDASTVGNALRPMPTGYLQHAVLNGVRVPLAAFSGVDLSRIRAVELRFDRTDGGRLWLSDLAFTAEGTGAATGPLDGPVPNPAPRPVCAESDAFRWACAATEVLWGRDADEFEVVGIAGWAGTAERRRDIARLLASMSPATLQHAAGFVPRFALTDLDPTMLEWLLSPAGRLRWDAARVELASGAAFTSPAVDRPEEIVGALYEILLGRAASAGEVAYWSPRVGAEGPAKLAWNLARTETHRRRTVERWNQLLLGAPPSSGRVAYWTPRLLEPGGEQTLVAALLATPVFDALATD